MIILECSVAVSLTQELESTASTSEDTNNPLLEWSVSTSSRGILMSWATFVNVCSIIAPICTGILSLAPFPTTYKITRDKSVGKLPLLPYSMMTSASSLWLLYGLLNHLLSVSRCSIVGVIMGAYYIGVFVKHCDPSATNLPGTVAQHLMVTAAIVLCNLCLAASRITVYAADIIGKEAVLITIILLASPLVVAARVIGTKNSHSIPLPFALASLLRCSTWVVAGWWKLNDFNLYFPNMLGVVFATVQIVLKCTFMHRSNNVKIGIYESDIDVETNKS